MKVLIVDDAAAVRSRLVELLEEAPGVVSVLEAKNSAEALDAVRTSHPRLVVLDLRLGEENGLDLVGRVREACCSSVVVVLTNEPSDHNRRGSLARGAHYFFDKSTEFDRVVDLVALLDRRG